MLVTLTKLNLTMLPKWIEKNRNAAGFIVCMNIFFSLFYFFIAHESLKLATLNNNVSPVWPPSGIALAILFCFGRRYLPAIFLGAFLANYLNPSSMTVSMLIALGNSLEALIGVMILQKINSLQNKFDYLCEPIAIAVAALISPLLSATIGVLTLNYANLLSSNILEKVWLTWWWSAPVFSTTYIESFQIASCIRSGCKTSGAGGL